MSRAGLFPTTEQRFIVERFARTIDAEAALLVVDDPDATRFFEFGDTSGNETPARTPFRGAAVDALEHAAKPEIRHIGIPQEHGGSDLVVAPVQAPNGTHALLCGVMRSEIEDPNALLWLAEGYAYVLALCAEDPAGIGKLIASTREDVLTGCATRAAICDQLDLEISRAERHERELACLYVDLDGFKSINDRYGHLVGDEVLAAAGRTMRRCLRSADSVGRVGGDEFVAVLPDTSVERAVVLARRVRSALRQTGRSFLAEGLSASVGVTGWVPGDRQQDLLGRADNALLVAKRERRGLHTHTLEWQTEGPAD